jgi:hypothetical protein
MSTGVSSAFVTLFEAEVKQAYQAMSQLRECVRLRTNVEGSTVKFPKVGKGTATLRVPQTDVTPMNVAFSQVTATMQDWNAAEYSDIFNQAKINFEERQELVMACSNAIGRRLDQIVIDALAASGTSLTIADSIGGTNSNLNFTKLRTAHTYLNKKNVPSSDRYLVVHANNLSYMLSVTQATSADFNSVRALVNGEIDTFMGFKWIVLGDRDEGGLSISGTDRKNYAFHKSAVGLAEGIGMRTEINYIPEKTSWLVNTIMSAGAVAIDAEGIVELTCDETSL